MTILHNASTFSTRSYLDRDGRPRCNDCKHETDDHGDSGCYFSSCPCDQHWERVQGEQR